MNLAPVNPQDTFVSVERLDRATGPMPKARPLGWDEGPDSEDGLVSIRYKGTDTHSRDHQVTVRNDQRGVSEPWYEVTGSLDDAVRAARELAVVEGYDDEPARGMFARTSVAVLEAGTGAWHLTRLKYSEGPGDGMDAIVSMPIDAVVGGSTSQVSLPYGSMSRADFDRPDKGVWVRFDDPRVAAVVGVDSIAVAPGR